MVWLFWSFFQTNFNLFWPLLMCIVRVWSPDASALEALVRNLQDWHFYLADPGSGSPMVIIRRGGELLG